MRKRVNGLILYLRLLAALLFTFPVPAHAANQVNIIAIEEIKKYKALMEEGIIS